MATPGEDCAGKWLVRIGSLETWLFRLASASLNLAPIVLACSDLLSSRFPRLFTCAIWVLAHVAVLGRELYCCVEFLHICGIEFLSPIPIERVL